MPPKKLSRKYFENKCYLDVTDLRKSLELFWKKVINKMLFY